MNEHQMTEEELMGADQAFWDFIEEQSSELQITADYFIYEFLLWPIDDLIV